MYEVRTFRQWLDFTLSPRSHPICFRPACHARSRPAATHHARRAGNAVLIGNTPPQLSYFYLQSAVVSFRAHSRAPQRVEIARPAFTPDDPVAFCVTWFSASTLTRERERERRQRKWSTQPTRVDRRHDVTPTAPAAVTRLLAAASSSGRGPSRRPSQRRLAAEDGSQLSNQRRCDEWRAATMSRPTRNSMFITWPAVAVAARKRTNLLILLVTSSGPAFFIFSRLQYNIRLQYGLDAVWLHRFELNSGVLLMPLSLSEQTDVIFRLLRAKRELFLGSVSRWIFQRTDFKNHIPAKLTNSSVRVYKCFIQRITNRG